MIKFKQGWVGTTDGANKVDILVKSTLPNKVWDIVIGGGLILTGVCYLAVTAFKNGAEAYEIAETQGLKAIGVLR